MKVVYYLKILFSVLAFLTNVALHAASESPRAPEGRSAGKPWLGIAIEKGKKGVLIKGVMPDTPAEKAGFKVGDEVLSIDKQPVNDPQQLISVVQSSGIGQTVAVEIQRGKNKFTKKLTLVMRPDELKIIRDKFVGKPAKPFNLELVHGEGPASSEKLKGKVVILEFWATWCPACRATHKSLSEFAAKNQGVAVIAVSDEEVEALKAYAAEIKPNFSIARDGDGKIQAEWMASAIPMIVVIDQKGQVAGVTVGAGESLEESLRLAVALQGAK